jgi:hypothetical protein
MTSRVVSTARLTPMQNPALFAKITFIALHAEPLQPLCSSKHFSNISGIIPAFPHHNPYSASRLYSPGNDLFCRIAAKGG